MATSYKYWAFISYSHQDSKWCDWLFKSLETYRVPPRIVGREACDGAIPPRLFPIFRDRDELPGSSELGRILTEALGQSRYLIVICSPAAARSRWVNEEIRTFKALGGENRILALIVDGEPNASEDPESGLLECFPVALKYRVDASGTITDTRVEPIAPDIRPGRDSKKTALLRLIAGLIGVSFDELRQRDRQRTIRQRVLAGIASLVVITGLYGAWFLQSERDRIAKYEELGRQELLANQPSRAAVYLAESLRLGNQSDGLRLMLGQVMPDVETLVTNFDAHRETVNDVALSPDTRTAVSAGNDKRVRLWDTKTGAHLRDLSTDNQIFLGLEFTADGREIVGRTKEGIRRWDAKSGEVTDEIPIGAKTMVRGPLGQGRYLLLSAGNALEVIRISDRKLVLSTSTLTQIHSVKVSPNGKWMVIADQINDGLLARQRVRLFDLETERVAIDIDFKSDSAVSAYAFDFASERLVLATSDGQITIWSTLTGKQIWETRYPSEIFHITFSPDGKSLLTAHGDKTAKVWDLTTGYLARVLIGHAGIVRSASFVPGGRRIITSSLDGTLRIWDTDFGETLAVIGVNPESSFFDTIVAGDGERALTHSRQSGDIRVWNLSARRPQAIRVGHHQRIISFQAEGRSRHSVLASIAEQGETIVWDTSTIAPRYSLPAGEAAFTAISPDGKRLAGFSAKKRDVTIWNALDGQLLKRLPIAAGESDFAAWMQDRSRMLIVWTRDGSRIVAATRNGKMRIFNANSYALERDIESELPWRMIESNETGEQLLSATKKVVEIRNLASGVVTASHRAEANEEIGAAHWLHGSRQLVVYSSTRVILLDAASGQVALTVESSGQNKWQFSYANRALCDGRYFAGSSSQRSPHIYDSSSGKLVSTLFGHSAQILNYACDPSQHYIATASTDGTTRVWRINDGKPIALFSGQPAVVLGVSFADGGNKIVTGGTDRALRVWSFQPEKRDASQVISSLRCRTTWKIEGWDLQPTIAAPSACRPKPSLSP